MYDAYNNVRYAICIPSIFQFDVDVGMAPFAQAFELW